MPFESKSQQRYLFAKHPAVAKEFASAMKPDDYKELPEHVEHAHGGMVCKSCGGEVMEDGYAKNMADGGEVEATTIDSRGERGQEGWEGEERQNLEGPITEQNEAKDIMSKLAFTDAIRRRRGAR